jgi:anti-sigma-K factor RskA
LGDAPEPPADLVVHVVDRVEQQRDRRRRGRVWRALAIAAAVLVVLGVSVGVIAARDRGSGSATVVQFPRTTEGSGSARLLSHDEGTEVRLAAKGLDDGDTYWLWLTGPDGNRVGAGTFRGTGEDVHVTLTAALPLEEAERIWVTDGSDKVVLDAHIQRA